MIRVVLALVLTAASARAETFAERQNNAPRVKEARGIDKKTGAYRVNAP